MTRVGTRRAVALAAGTILFAGFVALGVWQLQRLAWKLDLIARVDARVHAAAQPAPGPADWAQVSARRDEYRHVQARGTFDNAHEALVQAVTDLGPGYWVITPLTTADGESILVNRGFVPADQALQASRQAGLIRGSVTVSGLLRISEPHGGFLRANQPAAGRWYSRDVAAIARADGLAEAAPYFIDADATPNPGGWPRGGLTVIRFRNSHLAYAMTWFALAAMVAVWGAWPAIAARRARDGWRADLISADGPAS